MTSINYKSTPPAVQERLNLFRDYWTAFDQIHSQQAPGMKPLWGLVQDQPTEIAYSYARSKSPYQDGLYRKLLPHTLLKRIEHLWGTIMLIQWPERIVTEPFPHILMAETFGPALTFWHGCGLTAWFLFEGPMSRTNFPGMPNYYSSQLAALQEHGTPVDPQLFTDLVNATGKPNAAPQYYIIRPAAFQRDGTITYQRRKGFERFRDIISTHRRAWADKYLDTYLESRWQAEVQYADGDYRALLESRAGRPPTAKQFSRAARITTNFWFGGDISHLYAALAQPSPILPERVRILPPNPNGFATTLFKGFLQHAKANLSRASSGGPNRAACESLAELSLRYLQLSEARNSPPPLSDLRGSFDWPSKALSTDIEEAWRIFTGIIHRELNQV